MNPRNRVPSVEAVSDCKFQSKVFSFLSGSQIGYSFSNQDGI